MSSRRTHVVVLSALFTSVAVALAAAQGQPNAKAPAELSLAEFKGYENWAYVAPSQTPESIKVIAANPAMAKAYRNGLPAAGKTFPEGSKVVKIEWSSAPSRQSPYAVNVPQTLKTVSFIEKDSKRFPKTHGWAYAQFAYDPATKTLKSAGKGVECGYACHSMVAGQDYIFTAYPRR
jgi:hypothetical protein